MLRLRELAFEALALFPLKVESVEFINHGENATFKITARRERRVGRAKSETFLLRLHRGGYHTIPAIREEIDWLHDLASTSILAPRPVASRDGDFVRTVATSRVGPRQCDVFEWVPGRFVYKNMRPLHLEKFGRVLAELQLHARRRKVKHRRYWTAEGLLGDKAKFGPIQDLKFGSKKDRAILIGVARTLKAEFESFAKAYPDRMGLMHADLHFGNAVFGNDGSLHPIDFDDCGFGYYAYDLSVPFASVIHMKTLKPDLQLEPYRSALIKGYTSKKTWTEKDDEMFSHFLIARRILMVGWLNSRASNPKLKSRIDGAIERAVDLISAAKL